MYVEFIGTSGAGKTTVVGETVKILDAEGITTLTRTTFFDSNQKRNYKLLWTILHLHRLDIQMFSYLWKWAHSNSVKNSVVKGHEYIKLRQMLSDISTKKIALWDSGFVQLFSKMTVADFLSMNLAFTVTKKRLPENCLLVFMDTSVEEAINRKRERALAWSAASAKRFEERVADKKQMQNTYIIQDTQQRMLHRLAEAGFATVTLEGHRPARDNAAQLAQIIKKKIHG